MVSIIKPPAHRPPGCFHYLCPKWNYLHLKLKHIKEAREWSTTAWASISFLSARAFHVLWECKTASRADIPPVFIYKISQGNVQQHGCRYLIHSLGTLTVCIRSWMMNYHTRAIGNTQQQQKAEHPRMNVCAANMKKLSIPQGWDKSSFSYDNPTIHKTISSLTATYADVRGSAVLHWIGRPLKCVQQAGHIVADEMLKHCPSKMLGALPLTYLPCNSLWWMGPDWTCSRLNPTHVI